MTGTQRLRAVIYGLVFWFAAAMVIHLLPGLFDGGATNAAVLAASIPIAWVSIPIGLRAAGVGSAHAVEVNVLATAAATMADGVGITFLSPQLYAGVTPESQFGAAWILWGVGWILVFARLAQVRAAA